MRKRLNLLPFTGLILLTARQFLFPDRWPLIFLYLAFFVIIFYPGLTLAELSFRRDKYDLPQWIALSFSLSLAVLTIPVLAAYILKIKVETLFYFLLIFFSLPSAVFLSFHAFSSASEKSRWKPAFEDPFQKRIFLGLCALVVIAALRDFLLFKPVNFSGDIYVDWAEIWKFLTSPRYYGWNPDIEGIYTTAMHVYQIPVLLQAVLTKVSGSFEPYAVHAYLFPVSEIFSFLGLYFFLSSLIRNKSLVLFILLMSLWTIKDLGSLVSTWTIVPYYIMLGLVFRRLDSGDKYELAWIVFLGSVMFMYRVTLFSLFLVQMSLFLAANWIFRNRDKKVTFILLKVVVLIIVFSLPFIYLKFSHPAMEAFRVTDQYHPWRLIRIGWSMFYLNPLDFVYHSYPIILALVLSPWLLVYRYKPWALYLFITLTIPPLIQYIPPLATLASSVLSYLFIWKLSALGEIGFLVLKIAVFLGLVHLSRQPSAPLRVKSRIIPILTAGAVFLGFMLIAGLSVNYIIGHPALRENLRDTFNSAGFKVVWEHKHLLFVVLPVLIWVVWGTLWELRSRRFSRMTQKKFFLEIESTNINLPLITAAVISLSTFLYSTIPSAFEMGRLSNHIFLSLDEKFGPPPGIKYLKDKVPELSIILTEPEIGFVLPGYCRHSVYSIFAKRIAMFKRTEEFDGEERIRFTEDILNGPGPVTDEQYEQMIKRNIRFVYLTHAFSPPGAFDKFDHAGRHFIKRIESQKDALYELKSAMMIQ